MMVHIKPRRGIFAKDFRKGELNCTYREKQNSSCFLKHSLMSSVDTVELPSPERDHTHHQLPPSRQQDKARTHLIAEYKSEFLWVGPRSEMLKDPQTTHSQNDSDPTLPLFGHMLRPYWSFLDTHGHVRAPAWLHHTYSSSRGVTDTDSSI